RRDAVRLDEKRLHEERHGDGDDAEDGVLDEDVPAAAAGLVLTRRRAIGIVAHSTSFVASSLESIKGRCAPAA
ncbi:MAG TPA: hypothetical protein DD640_10180, partial [Clostridiales bacterium]|nr:hypothetical protein [Clostridiales bacterium]